MMDISFSYELDIENAPTGARFCSQEICFYSAPTSPSSVKLSAISGFQTVPTTTYEDANSNLDQPEFEFEFETSQKLSLHDLDIANSQKEENPFDHMPTMAFADELFVDGEVLPLIQPLKLPPRLLLQNENGNRISSSSSSTQSSRAPSPRSRVSVPRLPLSCHSLWNDDFDPFMAALKKVKEEKAEKPKTKYGLGHIRFLSPVSGLNYKKDQGVAPLTLEQESELDPEEEKEAHCCCGPDKLRFESQKEPLKQASRSPDMGSESNWPKMMSFGYNLDMERKQEEIERSGSWTRKRNGAKIMKFLFDIKPGTPTQSTKWHKDEKRGDLIKTILVRYKTRSFLCLGDGGRYVQ